MRKTIWNLVLSIVILAVAAYTTLPLESKLRLGKDLAGGVTLTYAVSFSPGQDPKEAMTRTIGIIKERIDPQGVMEIGVVPQGKDRIDITMPLPSERVKAFKRAYDQELEQLEKLAVSPARLQRALDLPADARDKELKDIAGGEASRETLLREAARFNDETKSLRAEYNAEPDAAKKSTLATRIAQAEIARDEKIAALLKTALSPVDVQRALLLPDRVRKLKDPATNQMVEIPSPQQVAIQKLYEAHPGVRDRLDAILAKRAEYLKNRKALDDPQDLIRILRGAGVLSFRIAVRVQDSHPEEARLRQELRERGSRNVRSTDARWFKINDIGTWYDNVAELKFFQEDPAAFFARRGYVGDRDANGEFYLLCWDTRNTRLTKAEGEWSVAQGYPTTDNFQRPAIGFRMDARGARLLGEMTAQNVGKPMAVLLDDQVYTAPNLNSAISASGIIEGDFPQEEINYIVRVLSAGSLTAKLSRDPVGQSVVGPDLGIDNLRKGLFAGAIAFGVCILLLSFYYFSCGLIAALCLVINVLCILGLMSINKAAFTLPGIAGVILTFAMAVDASVLVYERMREELSRGADLKTAVRLGFAKAMPALVDGNLTNLIVCAVLATFGTPEVRGFGVTMTIGVLCTLFAALFVGRTVFDLLVNFAGWRKTSMLPLAVPAVQRAFELKVRWMSYRGLFYSIFAVLLVLSVTVIGIRGNRMLDTEFLGGTEVTLALKRDASGQPMTLTRAEVDARVQKAATLGVTAAHQALRTAETVVVDPQPDGVTSSRFRVRVGNEAGALATVNVETVENALLESFADVVDVRPIIRFASSEEERAARAPVFAITRPSLGDNIEKPLVKSDVREYLGGSVIVLDKLSPPISQQDLSERLAALRTDSAHTDIVGHERTVIPLDGTPAEMTAAAVVVRSPDASFLIDQSLWEKELRDREWSYIREALTKPQSPLSLRSFSPAVAKDFLANAIGAVVLSAVLIVIYVWVRFGSLRFSAAAIIPTLLDCVLAVGLIATAEMICEARPQLGAAVGLLPFKIDLTVVAAVLTILGYSINDKIVVLDRIREVRGKLPYVTRDMIDLSINQVMSRTIMTGSTTILSTIILYIVGGEALRAFAYSLGLGVIIGTFSSIALGAPIAWSKRAEDKAAAANAA